MEKDGNLKEIKSLLEKFTNLTEFQALKMMSGNFSKRSLNPMLTLCGETAWETL